MESLTAILETHPGMDWSDGRRAFRDADELLSRIAANKESLLEYVENIRHNADLLGKCEEDEFRIKIMLHDALVLGFRVRLHVWKNDFADTPHQHRFPYCAQLLRGSYDHYIYSSGGQDLAYPDCDIGYEQFISESDERLKGRIDTRKFQPLLAFTAVPEKTYYQSEHVEMSSTVIRQNTVSLFVRGPALRDSSFQWHRDRSKVVWRGGVERSPREYSESVRLSAAGLERAISALGNS